MFLLRGRRICAYSPNKVIQRFPCGAPRSNSATSRRGRTHPKPVEQIDLKSGNVINSFPSLKAAARATGSDGANLGQVLQGRHKSAGGYFWRHPGSDRRPPSGVQGATSIEQVCLESGKLLHCYDSVTAAATTLGVSAGNISRVLCGKGRSIKGFFWRFSGSQRQPPPRVAREVEMICPSTGKVEETFESCRQAAKSLGLCSHRNIYATLTGVTKSCRGYHWRFKGTPTLPGLHTPRVRAKPSSNRACYLLESMNPDFVNTTYVGVTVKPSQRLLRHNGVRKGGAKPTEVGRPWRHVLLLEGFPSWKIALRFEYAWQHFQKSRAVRAVIGDELARKMGQDQRVEGQLAMLKILLSQCPEKYGGAPLTLHVLDRDKLSSIQTTLAATSLSGIETVQLPTNLTIKHTTSIDSVLS